MNASEESVSFGATSLSSSTSSRCDINDFSEFASFVYDKQGEICSELEQVDEKALFSSDDWTNISGKGRTRVLQNGNVFEKAGVNVSVLSGTLTKERADAITKRSEGTLTFNEGDRFQAASISLVLHTQSPFIPTLRSDVRLFYNEKTSQVYGGGGCDLTVYYLDHDEFKRFHQSWQQLLPTHYPEFKRNCDEYFYIPFRREHRGIGGIFYDDLQVSDLIDFQKSVANHFLPSYFPIIEKYKRKQYSAEQKKWQQIRRGRYLEFNLLNDRGVKFGLSKQMQPSRFESIMISAPPSVLFPYNFVPETGSEEEMVMKLLSNEPVDWAR